MADMFSRLADRATGAGTITPRLPTRFEGETSLEAEETTTASRPSAMDSRPIHRPAEVSPVPAAEAPKTGGLEVNAFAESPRAHVGQPPMVQPAVPVLLMPSVMPLAAEPAKPGEVSEPTPSRRATFTAKVNQVVDESRVRPMPSPDVVTATQHLSTVETRAVETRTTRRTAETPAAQQQRPVHIAIGRIEVRATPAPAQQPIAPAPQTEPQGLSLADYLRGNDGRPQ